MRAVFRPRFVLALMVGAGVCAQAQAAQSFAADYGLAASATVSDPSAFNLSKIHLAPLFESGKDYSGAGLSLQAGKHWFGQVGVGRTLNYQASLPSVNEVVNIGGGYRWSDGQSLSLQLSRNRGPGPGQRLGLAVNYDWPRYFVRFSYDPGVSVMPADNLRFSAGVRF